jgi:hypothetical protein
MLEITESGVELRTYLSTVDVDSELRERRRDKLHL